MKRHLALAKLLTLFLSTALFSSSAAAIDLNYNPELDAPKTNESSVQAEDQSEVIKRLPGERDPHNFINTHPLFLTGSKQVHETESAHGWIFKSPSISSDKAPAMTDERQSVKMSEEQMWQESGKNYDNNPLNTDNYRLNVEAEYTF